MKNQKKLEIRNSKQIQMIKKAQNFKQAHLEFQF